MNNEIFRVKRGWGKKIYHTFNGAMRAAQSISDIEISQLDWKPVTEEDFTTRTKYIIYNKTKDNYLNRRGQVTFLRFAHQYPSRSYAEEMAIRFKKNYYLIRSDELEVKEIKLKLVVEG